MTYKERLKTENPEKVYEGAIGGCWGCPGDYWDGAPNWLVQPCRNRDCTKCWNTEIPNYPANSHPSKVDDEYINMDIDLARTFAKAAMNEMFGIGSRHYSYPQIEDVIFNDPATIVFWNDGTKTVVKTQNGEPFDPEKGLAMAITKKVLGNKSSYYDTIKKWTNNYTATQKEKLNNSLNKLGKVLSGFKVPKITIKVEQKAEKKMTYREKLQKEQPDDVGSCYVGGCIGCPGSKWNGAPNMSEPSCYATQHNGTPSHENCYRCWNQEFHGGK